jgi:hypothetical protein
MSDGEVPPDPKDLQATIVVMVAFLLSDALQTSNLTDTNERLLFFGHRRSQN